MARPRRQVQDNLPEEADPPEVEKVDSNDDVIIWQNLSSDRMSVPELTDYAERHLTHQYSALDGVAQWCVSAAAELRPCRCGSTDKALAARGLSVGDVERRCAPRTLNCPPARQLVRRRIFRARVELSTAKTSPSGAGARRGQVRLGDGARSSAAWSKDRRRSCGNGEPGWRASRNSPRPPSDVERRQGALERGGNLPGRRIAKLTPSGVAEERRDRHRLRVRRRTCHRSTVPISHPTYSKVSRSAFRSTCSPERLAIAVVDDAIRGARAPHSGRRSPPPAGAGRHRWRFVPITFLEGDIGRLFTEFALTIAAAVGFRRWWRSRWRRPWPRSCSRPNG